MFRQFTYRGEQWTVTTTGISHGEPTSADASPTTHFGIQMMRGSDSTRFTQVVTAVDERGITEDQLRQAIDCALDGCNGDSN